MYIAAPYVKPCINIMYTDASEGHHLPYIYRGVLPRQDLPDSRRVSVVTTNLETLIAKDSTFRPDRGEIWFEWRILWCLVSHCSLYIYTHRHRYIKHVVFI